ncbi:hypothetical protein COCNU_scaffold004622G000010 [Cocos nucifera]|nr:hypothetical protein [Cocos nucifera]
MGVLTTRLSATSSVIRRQSTMENQWYSSGATNGGLTEGNGRWGFSGWKICPACSCTDRFLTAQPPVIKPAPGDEIGAEMQQMDVDLTVQHRKIGGRGKILGQNPRFKGRSEGRGGSGGSMGGRGSPTGIDSRMGGGS